MKKILKTLKGMIMFQHSFRHIEHIKIIIITRQIFMQNLINKFQKLPKTCHSDSRNGKGNSFFCSFECFLFSDFTKFLLKSILTQKNMCFNIKTLKQWDSLTPESMFNELFD